MHRFPRHAVNDLQADRRPTARQQRVAAQVLAREVVGAAPAGVLRAQLAAILQAALAPARQQEYGRVIALA